MDLLIYNGRKKEYENIGEVTAPACDDFYSDCDYDFYSERLVYEFRISDSQHSHIKWRRMLKKSAHKFMLKCPDGSNLEISSIEEKLIKRGGNYRLVLTPNLHIAQWTHDNI